MCETCSGVVHTTLVSGNYLSYHDSQRQALERIQSILDEADLPDPVPAYIQNIRESLLVLRYSKDVEQARRDHIRALHAAEERRRQREWVEHRLALSVRTQNILESEWIVTVDQLCGLSADELLQLRHMKEAQLEEIRTQLDKVGRCLRGERTSFDEDFERFMRLGKPKSVCEVFGFCREYVRGHPETRAEVLARMANSDNSRLVLNALPPLERWLRLQDESRAENDRKQKRHQLLQEAPESIRSALWRFDSYDSGCLSQEAFRWEIFHHIRPDNISLLEEYLGRLFGEPADDMSPIKHWLQDLLNDDDWDQPHWAIIGEEQEIAAAWESHRAGIATVKDYLESNSPD